MHLDGATLTVGRILGIRVSFGWSFLAVFALVVWALTENVFPDQDPGLSSGTYLAMGLGGGVLFFASVLLHELGHALQARRERIEVEGITLWMLGGVASFRGDFPTAGSELRVAAAGPLVSLVIGLVALGAGTQLPLPEALGGVVAWLGYTNLLLLAFNLLPAAPLDGGRILRSAVWALRGDRDRAALAATRSGRVFGALLAAAGVMVVLVSGALGGLWLVVLGWFLAGSATAEQRQHVALGAIAGLHVRDVMIPNPVTVDGGMTIGEFVDSVVGSRHFTTYPVVEDGRVSGLLPFRRVAAVPRSEWDEVVLADRMVPLDEVILVGEDDDLTEAIRSVSAGDLKRALVTDGALIVGLLSLTDVADIIDRALGRRQR